MDDVYNNRSSQGEIALVEEILSFAVCFNTEKLKAIEIRKGKQIAIIRTLSIVHGSSWWFELRGKIHFDHPVGWNTTNFNNCFPVFYFLPFFLESQSILAMISRI